MPIRFVLFLAGLCSFMASVNNAHASVKLALFSPDGKSIITIGSQPNIVEWSMSTGKVISTFSSSSDDGAYLDGNIYLRSVVFSADGTKILAGEDKRTIQVWHHSGGAPQTLIPQEKKDEDISDDTVSMLAVTADGARVAGGYGTRVDVWDATKGKIIQTIATEFPVSAIVFLDGGRHIAVTAYETIEVWDVKSAKKIRDFALKERSSETAMVISADGKSIISGDDEGSVTVWDVKTGKIKQSFHVSEGEINALALSPDRKTIAIGEQSGNVQLWDIQAERKVGSLSGHTDEVRSVAFSPDGKRIVSGSDDGTFRLWNVQKLSPILTGTDFSAQGWTSWTPEFAFVTSPGTAIRLFSEFDEQAGKFTSMNENFADEKARPDLVEKALAEE